MERDNYWTRRLRRRRMLQGAGIGVTGLAAYGLVGCGDDDDDGPTATATATAATGTATAATATGTAAAGPKRGGISVTQSANVYETVDPHRTVASPVLQVLCTVHSKILRFANPNTGELTGDLAEKWETPDAQTVVLNLRPGVRWHDQGPGASNPAAASGRALTADDIIYNVERQKAGLLADGKAGSFGRKNYWANVDSITAADNNTVRLTLKAPNAAFVQGFGNEFNLIVQKELIEAVEPLATEISADKVIGTGPNILTEWVPGKAISSVRNPKYFLPDRPYLDAERWIQTFEDPTAYRIAFEQKDVDSFTDPDPSVVDAVHQANKEQTNVRFSGVANTVAIYLPHAQAPWNDVRLVKAIHLAADRRQLIQQLHNGLGKVSGPVSWLQEVWAIPDGELATVPGYRPSKDQDLTEARALWQAGGGPSLGEITWVIPDTWASRAGWGSTPEIVAEMFNKAFGTSQFKARTKNYGEIIPAWFSKNFDPFFGWIPNVEIPDARGDMVGAFNSSSPANIWAVKEPDLIDAKLAKALTILDTKEAVALVREVQNTVLENGQYGRIIMYNYISPAARWNYLKSPSPSAEEDYNFLYSSLFALETWIDADHPAHAGRKTPSVKPL
jgi:peptide/nickel transport system substrate-binding protein